MLMTNLLLISTRVAIRVKRALEGWSSESEVGEAGERRPLILVRSFAVKGDSKAAKYGSCKMGTF